jgi:hypothetical protein
VVLRLRRKRPAGIMSTYGLTIVDCSFLCVLLAGRCYGLLDGLIFLVIYSSYFEANLNRIDMTYQVTSLLYFYSHMLH